MLFHGGVTSSLLRLQETSPRPGPCLPVHVLIPPHPHYLSPETTCNVKKHAVLCSHTFARTFACTFFLKLAPLGPALDPRGWSRLSLKSLLSSHIHGGDFLGAASWAELMSPPLFHLCIFLRLSLLACISLHQNCLLSCLPSL